jgi:germination protein M
MGLSNWPIMKEEMAVKKGSRSRARSTRRRGIGLLFWLCLLAIVVAVAFAARGSLGAAFSRMLSLRTSPSAAPAPSTSPTSPASPAPSVSPAPPAQPASPSRSLPDVTVTRLPETNAGPASPPQTEARGVASDAQTPPATPPQRPAVRKARLFFMAVDPDGGLKMKSVIRPIPSSDSPLRDALDALLKGPTSQELNTGLLSMIPTESHLRNVVVRDDTAYIDFNESFRFNAQGLDALNAQLRQVVYAATEFPSVKKVQLLIEGRKVQYLGTEGVRIDVPLSRASFRQ